MTNREEFIDNASNEDIAKVLCVALSVYDNFVNCGRKDYEGLYKTLSQYIYSKGEEAFFNHNSFNCLGEIEKWLSQEAELSADEMFEELGYKKISEEENKVIYSNRKQISIISYIDERTKKRAFSFAKSTDEFCCYINEQEDKAIHKKIEELKSKVGYK